MYHSRVVPTNQPYGRVPGTGLPGRSGNGNPGGAGGGPGRNTTTPTGTFNRSSGTRFKAGDVVMLLSYCGINFPEGTVVVINGIEQAPESTTKRPGQNTPWTQSDHDSLYRFYREFLREDTPTVITSWDQGRKTISHFDLSPAPGQGYAPEQYTMPALLYTNKVVEFRMPGRGNRDSMLVPTNTLCSAEAYATLKGNGPDGKPNGRQLIVKKNIKKCFYIVKAKYLMYSVDKDICNMKKEFSNFRALTPEELAQYSRSLVPPPGRFINWL